MLLYTNTEFDDDWRSKIGCTNVAGHQADHESLSAMLPEKYCGPKPELVLISCPVQLCVSLLAPHLPHPILWLPAVGTGSLWAELLCRVGGR